MAINRARFKRNLTAGLNTQFGLEYARKPEAWRQYMEVETENRRAYIEDLLLSGFGLAPVKQEGVGIEYDDAFELYVARYVFETIALAFAITEEAEEDGLYGSIGQKLSRALARSMVQTKAVKSANVLNNGFDTNFPMGDGQPVFSLSHPVGPGGQGANTLANQADLSESSLEDMLSLISTATDYRGIPIMARGLKLVIPPALMFTAERLLKSTQQVDTPNNTINAIKSMGMLTGGYVVDPNLTDPDAWFIVTDVPDGLKHIVRKAIQRGVEGDFETGNMRYKARERYAVGVTDWHGVYGSSGGG